MWHRLNYNIKEFYRFQLGCVPAEVFRHGHHLIDDAIHFLLSNSIINSFEWNFIERCQLINTLVSSTPLPSESYNRNITVIIGIERKIIFQNFPRKIFEFLNFTFEFVFGTAGLQQGKVADDVLERNPECVDVQHARLSHQLPDFHYAPSKRWS